MIPEKMFNEAQEIVRLYNLQLRKLDIIQSLPILEGGMILEYQDLTGNWYEYTKDLQENIHFDPLKTRVRLVNSSNDNIDWLTSRIEKTKIELKNATNINLKIGKGAKLKTYKECLNYIKAHKS